MKIKIAVSFCLMANSFFALTQSCDSTNWAKPGTYEVVLDTNAVEGSGVSTSPIMLSGDDLCLIESSRKPTEAVQLHIGAYLVTVFPKKKFADNTISE